MRISGNLYFCEWCRLEFDQVVGKFVSSDKQSRGKKNVSSQCICPRCFRHVSQKTKSELESKYATRS